MNELLLSAYRFHRSDMLSRWNPTRHGLKGIPTTFAVAALDKARRDAVNSVRRYAASPWAKPVTNGRTDNGCRWIENPAAMGLRFVGYCDKISDSIRHTGWFTDPHQDGKIRGCVYQLPGRGGKARFVAAHDNEDNGAADCGGPAYVDFSTIYRSDFVAEMRSALRDISKHYQTPAMLNPSYWAEAAHERAKKEAARAANDFAECEAEKEREYQTAWQAGSQYTNCLQELAEIRESVRQTIRDMKGACATLRALPDSLKARLRSSIKAELRERETIFQRMERLKGGEADSLYFWPGDERLQGAFNEGADSVVLR
jgi:hypothetical protein